MKNEELKEIVNIIEGTDPNAPVGELIIKLRGNTRYRKLVGITMLAEGGWGAMTTQEVADVVKAEPLKCGWTTCTNASEPGDSLCKLHRNQADHGVQPMTRETLTAAIGNMTELLDKPHVEPPLMVNKEELAQLRALLDRPLFTREPGDYWQEDENGVVFLRRKSGAPVLMMSRADYEDFKKWNKEG